MISHGMLAATYIVSPTGNNAHDGSLATPWLTIQHAANMLTPGDTVFVRDGIYREAVTMNTSGAVNAFISLRAFPNEQPIIDGSTLTVPAADNGLFLIDSQSYVIIDGFELRNYSTAAASRVAIGIFVTGSSHHIQLRNNSIHGIKALDRVNGNAHGIAIYGTQAPHAIRDVIVDGNELFDLQLGNSEALVLNGNVTDFIVSNNRVHDNDNIGLDFIGFEQTAPSPAYDQARDGVVTGNVVYDINSVNNPAYNGEKSAGGIYVDGGTRILIERNTVHDSNIGIEIASEHQGRSTSDITLRNNLIYDNHIAGIAMGGYDAQRGSTEHCNIINNTLFHNDSDQDGNGELYVQFDTGSSPLL